jgi:beta-ureidopropionase / N-carbamoyl-L-amino-acid hydrolase
VCDCSYFRYNWPANPHVNDGLAHTLVNYQQLRINPDRLLADFNELAQIGATVNNGISRLALSNEDLQARAWLAGRLEDIGLFIRDDDAANLSGVLLSNNPNAKHLLIGSHLDSVPDGGRYDSSLGVLAALECVRIIKETGIKLPVHLEIIDFTDEEGCWQSLFGSRALTGQLARTHTNDKSIDYGPFRAALFRAGIRPADIHKAQRDPTTIAGYLEVHIEQGKQLDEADMDIGVVTSIVGRTTYRISFIGQASHSGTTLMVERRDALLGASHFITSAHSFIRERYPQGIFNCGNIRVTPGSFNIIPARADLTIECRHADRVLLEEMEERLVDLAQEKASQYQLRLEVERVVHMPAATMSGRSVLAAEKAARDVGVKSMRMVSYAGHDAQIMSTYTPTGMIFVPSVDGISHSPKEFTEWRHVVMGSNVLLQTILRLTLEES